MTEDKFTKAEDKFGMTKKNHIFDKTAIALTLVACILAGCGKNEILGGGESDIPMAFSAYNAATKADASYVGPGTTTLPANSSFGVFAFYQEGDVYNEIPAEWNSSRNPDFMFNQQVTFDGTNYNYTPLRFWPSNIENTISFWAYYPYGAYVTGNTGDLKFYKTDGTNPYAADATDLPVANYTVSKDTLSQQDIMFAALQENKTYYNTTDGIVPLTFRHALALVDFVLAEGTNAEITSFNVSNLYWTGTCQHPEASPIVWTGLTDAGSFSLASLTLSGSSTIARLIMMPQTIDADATLSITYDIHFASYDPYHPEDIVYAGNSGSVKLNTAKDALNNSITEWKPGYHYVYNISAGFERIEFESAVATGWTDGNDNITVN